MRQECRKLTRQVHVKVAFLVVCLLSMAFGVAGAGAEQSYDPESGAYLKGKAAFENERGKYAAKKGDITVKELNKALRDIQSCSDEWSAEVQAVEMYPGIGRMLIEAYTASDGHFTLFEVADADDFYRQNKVQIKLAIEDRELSFSENEVKHILAWAGKVRQPYQNELAIPWQRFYASFQFVVLLNLLTAILYASNVFSYERTLHMDLVTGTMGPKAIRKIVADKGKALACLVGGQYLVSVAAICAAYFAYSGPIAWKSQIQTLYFTSILPLTYEQVFFLLLLSGLFACLAVVYFTAALNARLQKSMPALIAGVAVTFAPLLLRNFTMLPTSIMKLIQVLPVNAALVRNNLNSLYLYPFPGNGMPGACAILAVSALLMGIFACQAVRLARKYFYMD